MFRDVFSGPRAIFMGVVFFVLLAETRRKVQPLKNDNAARPAQDTVDTRTVNFERVETDPETDDTQAMSDDTGAAPKVAQIPEGSTGYCC